MNYSLHDVILLQKREIEQKLAAPYIERDSIKHGGGHDLIRVILGPRRAGKSFLAMRMIQSAKPFGYVNFDDECLADITDYDRLVAAIDGVYGKPRTLLLDEIQNLPKWELFVNRLQRQGYHLIVTGSNAHLLSRELATHLTGRHLPIMLFPFSFKEYLKCASSERTETEQAEALTAYLQQGGFPEIILKQVEPRSCLTTLFDSVLYKDIVRRFKIRSVQGLDDLAGYLASNIASEYSFNTLSRVTRCRSVHTVEKYMRHLEEAFLFFSLHRFSYKARDRLGSNKKIYCIDNGFVSAKGIRFSPDIGKLCENLVAVALKRRELSGDLQVFFWRGDDQEEVGFAVKEGLAVTHLIQVCWDVSAPKTRDREVRALLKAGRELDCRDLLILTESEERVERAEWHGLKGEVRFLPLYKWLRG